MINNTMKNYTVESRNSFKAKYNGILQSFKNKHLCYLTIEFETQNETFCRFRVFCIFMFTEMSPILQEDDVEIQKHSFSKILSHRSALVEYCIFNIDFIESKLTFTTIIKIYRWELCFKHKMLRYLIVFLLKFSCFSSALKQQH